MIPYLRDTQAPIPAADVKIIGLGGAGSNMLERIALDGIETAELLALNTDLRTLNASISREKIQLGVNLTKGLGAGGDPELGLNAMLEAEAAVRKALKGRRIVFLCTGLGGGTGSGAAPIVTRVAREEGAFVVVFATMPFAFEGRRRREQADTALNELAVLANALVTFDNNRMGELVLAKQGVHEAFNAADRMICESIKAVIRLVIRPGIVNVGLDDLMTALRTTRSRCLFGSGMADGKDRAARALRNALASPLLDQGSLLRDAQSVLVHLSGGENLTLYEIELLMQQLQKYVPEKAHILFGAAIDPTMGDSLSITLISALPEEALASAPRESLSISEAAATPALDPSQGFTPEEPPPPEEPQKEEEPAIATFSSFDPEPIAKPETKPEPEHKTPLPAEPEPKSAPEPESKKPPESKPKSIFTPVSDDTPFAEPVPKGTVAATPARIPDETPPPKPEASQPKPSKIPTPPPESGFVRKNVIPPRRTEAREAAPAPSMDDGFTKEVSTEGKSEKPETKPTEDDDSPAPRLALNLKAETKQSELTFDSLPRGRFQGEGPNVVDGEDLDLPPFLRKKG